MQSALLYKGHFKGRFSSALALFNVPALLNILVLLCSEQPGGEAGRSISG